MPRRDSPHDRAYQKEYRRKNAVRISAQQRAWVARNRAHVAEYYRAKQYRTKFGITIADYDAMLAAQGGMCAICGTDKPRGAGRFHVDHDHATGRVRGILCHLCNTRLGWVEKFRHQWEPYLASSMAKGLA